LRVSLHQNPGETKFVQNLQQDCWKNLKFGKESDSSDMTMDPTCLKTKNCDNLDDREGE